MNPTLLGIDRAGVETLGWTLVHFVWQGALVAAALATIDLLLARAKPQARYVAACLALVSMLAITAGTFVRLRGSEQIARVAPALSLTVEGSDLLARPPSIRSHVSISGDEIRNDAEATAPRSGSRSLSHFRSTTSRSDASLLAGSVVSTTMSPSRRAASDLIVRLGSLENRLFEMARDSRVLIPGILWTWSIGVVLLTIRLIGGWWLVQRLSRSRSNLPIEEWQERLTRLARAIGLTRPIRLFQSALVEVPTVIGSIKPVILIPASTLIGLSPQQIEAILAHELAHVRRHDYLVNLLQSVIETVLFYHPAVWWVSRRVREERELCCDDLAVRVCGDPVGYARALYEIERRRGADVGLAVAATGGSLIARIARLLGNASVARREPRPGFVGALGATGMIALLAVSSLDVRAGGNAPAALRSTLQQTVQRIHTVQTMVTAQVEKVAQTPIAQVLEIGIQAPAAAPAPEAPMPPTVPDVQSPAEAPLAPEACASAPQVSCDPKDTPEAEAAAEADEDADVVIDIDNDTDENSDAHDHDRSTALARFSPEDQKRLAQAGIDGRFVLRFESAGYPGLSADQLVALANHGVSPSYARKVRRAGLAHVSPEQLIELANHGVSPEYIKGFKGVDHEALDIEQLIRLANSGVDSKWYSAMTWLGVTDLTPERAIQLSNNGVNPEYVSQIRQMVHRRLSPDELIRLVQQGVSPEFIAGLHRFVKRDTTIEALVRLRQQGVTPDFVESMEAIGYGLLSAEELIRLRQQGVDPEFVAGMTNTIGDQLPVNDLIRLRQQGVSLEFVNEVRESGYSHPSVDDLVRMRQRGIKPRREIP